MVVKRASRKLTEVQIVANVDLWIDSMYQTREVDRHNNEQCQERAPIDAGFVPVDTLVLVERGYMEVCLADKIVVGHLGTFSLRVYQKKFKICVP